MKAIAIALIVSLLAFSAQAAECGPGVPCAEATPVKLMPAPGSDAERIAIAKVIAACYAENAEKDAALKSTMHPVVFVAITAGTAIAAGFAGFGIAKAIEPKK